MTVSDEFELHINGVQCRVAGTSVTLLEVLREQLGLTGTKFNCEQGECGACTVMVDGQAIVACLALAPAMQGTQITTIEGVGTGPLSEVQQRFIACDALQCGFCTPGMILAVSAFLATDEEHTSTGVRAALSGNYCRCTGYEAILHAIAPMLDGES